MQDTEAFLAQFYAVLDGQSLIYDRASKTSGPTVYSDLYLADTDITELPQGLTVRGAMDLAGTAITRLPDGLVVTKTLYLDGSQVTFLPGTLCVGGSISLQDSSITSLPDFFQVHGRLDLRNTPIAALPMGLHVEDDLNLQGTRITVFPEGLRVGGRIAPPGSLRDIQAFMATRTDTAVFPSTGPHHHRLDQRAQLRDLPDLARVVDALGDLYQLCIMPQADGTYLTHCFDMRQNR